MTINSKIREYTKKDKTEVLNLFKLNTPFYFSADEVNDLIFYLENEIEHYFVIEIDNKIVGCGGINLPDNKTNAKISWDIFHPDFQGKKLGSKLLKFRIDKLNKIDTVKKITVRTSQLVYKFYEKHGFELFEIVENFWADGFHLYNMEYKNQ